jgi:hypothetical protein
MGHPRAIAARMAFEQHRDDFPELILLWAPVLVARLYRLPAIALAAVPAAGWKDR